MFELIYKIFSDNKPDEIIVLMRSCNIDDINNAVDKYKIPIRTESMTDVYDDGFWIRELKEIQLVEEVLNKYLHYQSHKQKLNDNLDDWLSKFKKKFNL